MTQKQMIIKIEFTDVATGRIVSGHMTLEMWDKLSLFIEQRIAEAVKQNGLRKDLG